MNTFCVCEYIKINSLACLAEVTQYPLWSDEFSVNRIRNLPEKLKQHSLYSDIDPSLLTKEEMDTLGFAMWSDDSKIRLIPLWLLPYLKDGITLYTLSEKSFVFTSENFKDNDNRFGCIAYGVYPAEISDPF